MVQLFWGLIKTARPKQTLKNLAVIAPLIFSGNLFVPRKIFDVFWTIIVLTIATSSVYFLNDIIDLPRDRLHPFKRKRPIAAGTLPLPIAIFVAVFGFFLSLCLAYQQSFFFFLTVLAYLTLQITYTFWLKHLIVLDVMAIAGGFVLRVYAGALAINVHMSVWFLLCVVSLALFLAVGKRRGELAILTEKVAPRHRQTLTTYSASLLDSYLAMSANSAWLAYALFTFFAPLPPIAQKLAFFSNLPLALAGINKWLMLTVPVVIYGVMRYMSIIYQGSRAESPESVLLSDKPLLASVLLWGIMVVAIIYGVGT